MSSQCESYYSNEKVFVDAFTCPRGDSDTTALYCCGFNDLKYCCDDPNSFYPYEYGYMWWLSLGALVGLSVAAVVLLAFIITLCVLCYLFITTKPKGLDNGLPLRAQGTWGGGGGGGGGGGRSSHKGLKPANLVLCRCFMATVTSIDVEGPA
uniref:Shisa N-terminal domain-containing protein n=1 Tax=Echeneis naucrates TaxID=173247 RepID=A0A665WNF2_ECHNA